MVTENVIKEIYKKYKKPPKDTSELNLDHYLEMLKEQHNLSSDGFEVVLDDLEEFNPFKRFLIRALLGIIEFENVVAFVFSNHIVFLGKHDNSLRVHLKPEEKKSIFSRLFGGGDA